MAQPPLVEGARTVDQVAAVRRLLPRAVTLMLDRGVSIPVIGELLAEADDRITRRLLELAHEELGTPPVPFCWLAMGSQGRREQTIYTDQDNGLIYADDDSPAVEAYFERLAQWMVDALETCGTHRCVGEVMATNPLWRGPYHTWRARFGAWLQERAPGDLLNALIAFDFFPVYGETALADDLRDWLLARTPASTRFLGHLAYAATSHRSALGFFGGFAIHRRGPYAGSIDIKLRGIRPVVDGARLLALKRGIPCTSTLRRLARAEELSALPTQDAGMIRSAFITLQELRLKHHLAAIDAERPPDNRVVPARLDKDERERLRDSFRVVQHFMHAIELEYAMQLRGGG